MKEALTIQVNLGEPKCYVMDECPFRKVENIKRVSTVKFIVMVETKSLEFWNKSEIRGYDD